MADKVRFQENEKKFLISLIEKYKTTIESKASNSTTIHAKKLAWAQITEEFNSQGDHYKRTPLQLSKCWDNIKTKRKKELAAGRMFRMGTGGGPFKNPKRDYQSIDNLLQNPKEMKLSGHMDSDSTFENLGRFLTVIEVPAIEENDKDEDVQIPVEELSSENMSTAPVPNEMKRHGTCCARDTSKPEIREHISTAQQAAENIKLAETSEAECEIYRLRIIQEKLKIQIFEEQLKKAKVETDTALIIKFREENSS